MKKDKILYLVASFSYGEDKIVEALRAGVDIIQLREKNLSGREYYNRARRMRELTRKYPTLFLVNDRVDIAVLSDADGVHLGQADVPIKEARKLLGDNRIIGATAKTMEQAKRAQELGADYIGSGAFFSTATKLDATVLQEETYREIRKILQIPSIAIGGITEKNCYRPLSMKADGIAVSAGILASKNITKTVDNLRAALLL